MPAVALVTGPFIAIHGAATLATVALNFGNYLQALIDINSTVIALVLIGSAAFVNVWALRE